MEEFIIRMARRHLWLCLACTGTTVVYIAETSFELVRFNRCVPAWGQIVYHILILPIYNVFLLAYRFYFGQFKFFYEFDEMFLNRIFLNFGR